MIMLSDTIETLQELQRMHQLNIELVETMTVACSFLLQNHVEIPNKNTFQSLLRKAWTLLDEIKADAPKIVQYRKLADEKKQHPRTDEDVPEPRNLPYKAIKQQSILRMFQCRSLIVDSGFRHGTRIVDLFDKRVLAVFKE
jgi:hypothetical protein